MVDREAVPCHVEVDVNEHLFFITVCHLCLRPMFSVYITGAQKSLPLKLDIVVIIEICCFVT